MPAQEERGVRCTHLIQRLRFEDVKGYRRGDIINVLLAERTAAQKSSGTNVSKSNEATIENPTLGGEQRMCSDRFAGNDFNFGFGLVRAGLYWRAGATRAIPSQAALPSR